MTAIQHFTRCLEACTWALRSSPWPQLASAAFGFFLFATLLGHLGSDLFHLIGVGVLVWIGLQNLGRRCLPFSEQLRNRWLVEKELGRRFESYRFRNYFWMGMGAISAILLFGGPYYSYTVALMCLVPGAIALYRWKQTRIDERNYQPNTQAGRV